jgi:hypothetical protein
VCYDAQENGRWFLQAYGSSLYNYTPRRPQHQNSFLYSILASNNNNQYKTGEKKYRSEKCSSLSERVVRISNIYEKLYGRLEGWKVWAVGGEGHGKIKDSNADVSGMRLL